MILQLTRLTIAVLANAFSMGNAFDDNQDKVGGVLKQQKGVTSSTVERSLDNIFQVLPQETSHETAQSTTIQVGAENDEDNSNIEEEVEDVAEHGIVGVASSSGSILLVSSPATKKKGKSAKASPTSQPSHSPTTSQPSNSPTAQQILGGKIYTFDSDFDTGSSINVNHNVQDELQLDNTSEPFDFIWVACSGRGTVVKVNTLTGAILGEYRSAPDLHAGNPSRTTVDNHGSVWLSNRNNVGPNNRGTIVHIGLLENNQCEDRNGDGIIQTSQGLADIRAWFDESGERGVQTAEDECIVHYTEVSSTGTRHVSIDANNDVWVGGTGNYMFDKVNGGRYDEPDSGTIVPGSSYYSFGYGGYGGLIDPSGFLWSARPLLRWNTLTPLTGPNGDIAFNSIGPLAGFNWAGQTDFDSYGLCIDSLGNVWNTEYGSYTHKYSPTGVWLDAYYHGDSQAQGCVVDLNDHVWVAHSKNGGTTVGHLDNAGVLLGSVTVGSGPTGVAVDNEGKIWSTNYNSNNLSRIDPTVGLYGEVDKTVELGSGCSPYNYGDMTGSTNIAPPNAGTWAVTYDHGTNPEAWGRIQWTEDTPGNSDLTVQVSTDGATGPWTTVSFDEDLSLLFPTVTGQYLYVQVLFTRATGGESPVLKDLSITFPGRLATDSPSSSPTSVPTTPVPTSKASKAKSKSKSRSTGKPTRQPTNEPTEGSDSAGSIRKNKLE